MANGARNSLDDENEQVQKYEPDHPENTSLDTDDNANVTPSGLKKDNANDEGEFDIPPGEDKPYYHFIAKGRPMPVVPGDRRDFSIEWLGDDDPENPLNWPHWFKYCTLGLAAISAVVAAFGSAVISPAVTEIQAVFHVGLPVAALNVSLYVVGFAVGPIIWGPSSERTGRYLPLCLGVFGLMLFSFASATAKDFQTLVLCRFFSGVFSASSLAVGPALTADIFPTKERGRAIAIVSLMIVAGPMVAPVVGGYIAASFLGWRWTMYILGIFSALVLVICVFFLSETYPPKLLANRARNVRNVTGNWAVRAPLEEGGLDMKEIVANTVGRPLTMLVVEPILFLISLYIGFIYGILYLCLEAIPIIFTNYGWPGGNIFLPYLAMLIGAIIVVLVNIFYFDPLFLRKLIASGLPALPEERLPLMMVSGIAFPMGIFLLCWSGAYHVMWVVPCVGASLIGFGLIGIFMSAFNYIIDTYLALAASAIAANTFLRSGFGAAFPLFAHPMFINLGTQWAGTLLGCLSVLLVPVPFLFFIFGKRIRQKSRYAFDLEGLDEMLSARPVNSRVSRISSRISTRPSAVP